VRGERLGRTPGSAGDPEPRRCPSRSGTCLTAAAQGGLRGPEPRGFDAPRVPPERIAAVARELVDRGRQADALAVARQLLASAERRRRRDPAAAADRAALAVALLAEARRRT